MSGPPHIFPTRRMNASAYGRGCRCEGCKKANSERQARTAAALAVRPRADVPHGTLGGYVNWSCRCPDCLRAGSLHNALPGARRNLEAGRPLTELQAEALEVLEGAPAP